MKYFTTLLCAAASSLVLSGCISKEVEPQQVVINPQDGSLVIFKDLYEIHSDNSINFGNSRVFPLYNANTDGIPGNYDINIVVMEAGLTSALFTQKTTQIIYVLSGGGLLNIDGKAYELREGIGIYVPADKKMKIVNSSPYVLKYMVISLPSGEAAPIVLEEAPATDENAAKLSDKDLLEKSEAIRGNANTSATLDQITPISLNDASDKAKVQKAAAAVEKQDTAAAAQADVAAVSAPVKPETQVSEVLSTQEKIMQDKQ
jgi:quercetin dioxygenase-like cupin family protein